MSAFTCSLASSMSHMKDLHAVSGEIRRLFHDMGEFVYYPNFGNLGDLLIAEGSRQFFAREGLSYREYDPAELPESYNLVFAGGARFTSFWCDVEECLRVLTDPRVRTCVILPHSFHDVDALLAGLDGRHHLFCRDEGSYRYCLSRRTDYAVYLAPDMAFHLNLSELSEPVLPVAPSQEELNTRLLLEEGLLSSISAGVRGATVASRVGGAWKKVAFLLRKDREKSSSASTMMTYDVSAAWHTSGRRMAYNGEILEGFSMALKQADIVVSDRLHVCIMAYLSGLEVYMLDNSYGKLSGVYQLSMSDSPRVHLLLHARLTPELEAAWRRLNAPWKVFLRRCRDVFRGLYRRGRAVVSRLCRCV